MNPLDVDGIWRALEAWDRERPRSLALAECRVQLYMGAMEIPMLALRPRARVRPAADRLATWTPQLERFELVLDCVTDSANYKLNRAGNGEYVGRILPDALKFHAERLLGLGPGALAELGVLYLALPAADGRARP
jgi:hypothetical protein